MTVPFDAVSQPLVANIATRVNPKPSDRSVYGSNFTWTKRVECYILASTTPLTISGRAALMRSATE